MWNVVSTHCIKHVETGLCFTPLAHYWRVDLKSLDRYQSMAGKAIEPERVNILELECALWAYGRELMPEPMAAVA